MVSRVRSRGYLPHVEGAGYVQHVVFWVKDALPAALMDVAFADVRARTLAAERYLDRGFGLCPLSGKVAEIVDVALRFFEGTRYALHAYVVMPNHVHALVEPFHERALSSIVHSWKSYTAKKILASTGDAGRFWAREWYDRFIRNEAHFFATVRYIERNPVAAGLCAHAEDWPWSSARDEVCRRDAGAK
jgi:putative DNA methylase